MTGSALCFAVMGVFVKIASTGLGNAQVVFCRNAIAVVALLPLAFRLGWRGLATAHPAGHLLRSAAGLGSMYCFFLALAKLRVADGLLLNNSFPLFIPLVEGLWLGEAVAPGVWGPLGLGLFGMLLVLKPGLGVFQLAAVAGAASAVLSAIAQVGVRQLTRTEPVTRIVFYFCLLSAIGSAPAAALTWHAPGQALWLALLAVGVLASLGQLCLTRAYAHAAPQRVGPFIYTSVVFGALLDWGVWGARPDLLSGIGAVVVTLAGILALRLDALARVDSA